MKAVIAENCSAHYQDRVQARRVSPPYILQTRGSGIFAVTLNSFFYDRNKFYEEYKIDSIY
jgi:hypothetical protein